MNKILILVGTILLLVGSYSCSEDPLKSEGDLMPLDPEADNEDKLDNDKWDWLVYPGEVVAIRERLDDISVVVKGGYTIGSSQLNVFEQPKYWQSSGLYVAPAEKVVVVVPAEAGAGQLHYQIGIADIDLSDWDKNKKRYDNVVKKGVLEPGTDTLIHNFGGHLYFYYEGTPNASDITVIVNGAVKSPDFILESNTEASLATWRKEVLDSLSPMIWGELIGKNVAFTLPIKQLREMSHPEAVLNEFDGLVDGLNTLWGGDFDQIDGIPLWRFYADIQIPTDEPIFGSYPLGLDMEKENILDEIGNIVGLGSPKCKLIINALGKNYLTPWYKSDILSNVIPQISTHYLYNKRGIWPLNEDLRESPILDNMTTFASLDDKFKVRMLLQLAQEYGWGIYTYVNTELNKEFSSSLRAGENEVKMSEQVKNDLFAIAVSSYATTDLSKFFDAWRFPLTSYSKSYMAEYTSSADPTVWENFGVDIPDIDKKLTPIENDRKDPMLIKDTVYDPAGWKASASSEAEDKPASLLLDADHASNWHNNWGSSDHKKFPHDVFFNFDTEEPAVHELEFNYVTIWQVTGVDRSEVEPKEFQIQILNGEGKWENIDDDRVFFLNKADGGQKYFLNKAYKTRGVKMVMLNLQRDKDGARETDGDCLLGGFRIGLIN